MALPHLDPIVSWILRAALATLFATAALHKLRQPRAFLDTFSEYQILPSRLTLPAVTLLVMMEAFIAIGLLTDSTRMFGSLAGAALLTLYSLAIGVNLARGRRGIDCGCLGPAHRQTLSSGLLLRNGLLATAAMTSGLPISSRALHSVDAITLLGGFVAVVLLFYAINLLTAISSPWPELDLEMKVETEMEPERIS